MWASLTTETTGVLAYQLYELCNSTQLIKSHEYVDCKQGMLVIMVMR